MELIPVQQQTHTQVHSECFEERFSENTRLMGRSWAAWSKNKDKQRNTLLWKSSSWWLIVTSFREHCVYLNPRWNSNSVAVLKLIQLSKAKANKYLHYLLINWLNGHCGKLHIQIAYFHRQQTTATCFRRHLLLSKNVKQMNVNVLLGFISQRIQKISVISRMLFVEVLMAASLQC